MHFIDFETILSRNWVIVVIFSLISCCLTCSNIEYNIQGDTKDNQINDTFSIIFKQQNERIDKLEDQLREYKINDAFWSLKFGSLTQTYATIFTIFMGFVFAFNFFSVEKRTKKKLNKTIKKAQQKFELEQRELLLETHKMKENSSRFLIADRIDKQHPFIIIEYYIYRFESLSYIVKYDSNYDIIMLENQTTKLLQKIRDVSKHSSWTMNDIKKVLSNLDIALSLAKEVEILKIKPLTAELMKIEKAFKTKINYLLKEE